MQTRTDRPTMLTVPNSYVEEAFRDGDNRFRAIVERGFEGIALLDREGGYQYVNAAGAGLLGTEPAALVAEDFSDRIHPADRPLVIEQFQSLLERSGYSVEAKYRVRRRDGSWRWLEATVGNRLSDPAIRAVVLNFRDVTDRKRLEAQDRQVQKTEALGALASGVAHDFNNLLTVINGYSEILLEGTVAGYALYPQVVEIFQAGQRAANLTRQLLAYGRKAIIAARPVELNDVVAAVERLQRPHLGKGVVLKVERGPPAGFVHADRGQLEQVLANLVENARNAMPSGGTLTIRTTIVDRGSGRFVQVSVSDTGVGMSDEVKARVFEPFFTTKGGGMGTGLGLAIVQRLVLQWGGTVEVDSEPGAGTTFRMSLPQVEAASDSDAPRPTS